jgi:hypothetical protein
MQHVRLRSQDEGEGMSEDSRIGTKIKAYCSSCRGERYTEIHGHYAESGGDRDYQWYRDWYLLTCCGCDHVFAQSVSSNSQDLDYDYDERGGTVVTHYKTIESWPAKAKRERPAWFNGDTIESERGTIQLDASLKELYGALDHDLNVLASIGMSISTEH